MRVLELRLLSDKTRKVLEELPLFEGCVRPAELLR